MINNLFPRLACMEEMIMSLINETKQFPRIVIIYKKLILKFNFVTFLYYI